MNSTNSTSHDSDSAPSPQVGSPPPPVAPPPSPQSSPPPPPPESNASPPPPKSPTPSSNDSNASAPPPTSNTSRPSTPDTVPPPPPSHRASHSSKALSPPPPASSSSGSNSESSGGSGSSSEHLKISVGVSVGIGLFVIAMILLCVFCKKKRKRHHLYLGDPHAASGYYKSPQNPTWPPAGDNMGKLSPGGMAPLPGWHPQPPPSSGDMSSNYGSNFGSPLPPLSPSLGLGFNKSTFTYEELATATGGFAQENVLGQGGFGYVHQGLLPNGKEIAVKSLKSGSGQGEREFQAEVDIISRVHHRYLVSLVGYCIAGGQRMLVYEFVPNKTLEHHLHDKGLPVMDWPTRLKIAMGSAKGLAYLHEDCHPRIIHRDIKSANILLDYNFEAKVADFGLAKLNSDNYTHVSTRVMGTFGYLAPEYASSGKLTEKSDVFSFGVMLLELITGKKPVDPTRSMEDGLVDWARPLLNRALEERKYDELVDFRLENNYNPQEMHRMVACAAASIRHSAKKRPKMSQIVRALEGDVSLEHLNEGIRPGQSSALGGGNFSSDYDASAYNADMEKFRQVAFASLEFSGDHGT